MTQILDGKIIKSDISKHAIGGTELIIDRMIKHIPQESFNGWQIIHSRIPDELSADHKKMLVFHDLPNDPMYDKLANEEYRNQFDIFIFVSNWQQQYFNLVYGIPYSKSFVIENMIETFEERDNSKNNDIMKFIYHTTPHRGLEILVPVFRKIREKYGNKVELEIYSSFEIYGWRERDEKYKDLFELARKSDGVHYSGFVTNDKIRERLKEAEAFIYPSIWPETSCLAAIEAMAAGASVIYPHYGALTETCAVFGYGYQWTENKNEHADRFYSMLDGYIQHSMSGKVNNMVQQTVINEKHSCENISRKWKNLLDYF